MHATFAWDWHLDYVSIQFELAHLYVRFIYMNRAITAVQLS